jgi:hypothetical protein
MEFCLFYEGKLKSRDGALGKHAIRSAFDRQIRSICHSETFRQSFVPDWEGKRKSAELAMYVERRGKRFWFLIAEHLAATVDLSLTVLVPHEVARVVNNGGDIDNRIKTLFDALRVPAADSEIPSTDPFDYSTGGMYCLLQDDKLINRISVRSYQDHGIEEQDHVRCLIEVETKITRALWGNLNFV